MSRLDNRINKTKSCWLWTGSKTREGYGQIWFERKPVYVHRFYFELLNGPIPNGKIVMHKCDVPLCVNPKHLTLGTHRDNMIDKIQKKEETGMKFKIRRVTPAMKSEMIRMKKLGLKK